MQYASEDEDHVNTKDLSQDYSELERDYEEFLSECGISKWDPVMVRHPVTTLESLCSHQVSPRPAFV